MLTMKQKNMICTRMSEWTMDRGAYAVKDMAGTPCGVFSRDGVMVSLVAGDKAVRGRTEAQKMVGDIVSGWKNFDTKETDASAIGVFSVNGNAVCVSIPIGLVYAAFSQARTAEAYEVSREVGYG